MIAIIDYGVGNLFSLRSSFHFIGAEACVSSDPDVLRKADRLILPGVGAFADAAAKLRESGLAEVVREEAGSGKPLMGICLGMQMLFERSLEYGEHMGLGLLPGSIVSMEPVIPANFKVPHIGWNQLYFPADKPKHSLFSQAKEGDHVYFVHTYYAADCDSVVIANTDYGAPLTAAVAKENVMGCQFHPEKSGPVGLNILRAFCRIGGAI